MTHPSREGPQHIASLELVREIIDVVDLISDNTDSSSDDIKTITTGSCLITFKLAPRAERKVWKVPGRHETVREWELPQSRWKQSNCLERRGECHCAMLCSTAVWRLEPERWGWWCVHSRQCTTVHNIIQPASSLQSTQLFCSGISISFSSNICFLYRKKVVQKWEL